MSENPSCPFCESHRLTLTDETTLLRHYRCGYCHKEWGEARVSGHGSNESGHVHPLPRWVNVAPSD